MKQTTKLLDWFARKGVNTLAWIKSIPTWEEVLAFCSNFKVEPPPKEMWDNVHPKDEPKDFLDEIVEERTAQNPDFPQLVDAAQKSAVTEVPEDTVTEFQSEEPKKRGRKPKTQTE
jgi:hypothetical protein